jgi:hypothetical protein
MRSFSGVDLLIAVLAVLALCAVVNPHAAYHLGEWLYGVGSSLIRQAEELMRGSA